jgi:uncharacterized protein
MSGRGSLFQLGIGNRYKGRILKQTRIVNLLFEKHKQDSLGLIAWLPMLLLGLYLCLVVFVPRTVFAQAAAPNPARHALIIANTDYDVSIGRLRNPINDARLLAGALGQAGFGPANVRVVENQDQRQMRVELLRFADRLRKAGPDSVGFLYFAGHGVQRHGVNYLLPVRENLADGDALRVYAVSLDRDVFDILREVSKTLFVVIDACRDTPSAFRSGTRGLAMPTDTQDIVVAFSTEPGRVALDGEGANSPFATALAEALPKPGVEAATMLRDVRRTVQRKTSNAQMPHITEGLAEDFYFVAAANIPAPPPRPVVPDPVQLEALFWQGTMAANTKAAFEDYLRRYPTGQFASLAEHNVARFNIVPPPAPVPARVAFTPERWGLSEHDFSVLDSEKLLEKARFVARVAEFQTASDAGDPYAHLLRALGYRFGKGVAKNDAEFARLSRLAAVAGNSRGMTSLGFALRHGQGLAKNETEAVRWYRAAAEAGNALGMTIFGVMVRDGIGTARNETEAVRWFRAAADAGENFGMNNLGIMLANGTGIARNDTEAVRWYRAAAEAGNSEGMNNLGVMLETGRGVTKNETEAVRWYRAAAGAGDQFGQVNLATALDRGAGVPRNPQEALRWARAALAGPDTGMKTKAQALIDKLAAEGVR